MTDYLRSGPNAILAHGTSWKSVPFVSIGWLYLVGPIAIELAALLFAVMTINTNRSSQNKPVWKASLLLLLFCQFYQSSGKILAKYKDAARVEDLANKCHAHLE
ncbi:hypothetical protein VFPPC_17946 [Pochonia chlamydosporia 170]|uniref:Uncharacterized protein n=1 Tax=Pochonia chlamydosporia 170 TaxID=1380566 RepID=A0A219AQ59_METCM|nr:hypothetical protein VFPPC_17946 [Pochonia chlamydosporia 170]OWT42861.1 hypothetical protein VFPPC_17946 [Pochonia chlamydosporia 170]